MLRQIIETEIQRNFFPRHVQYWMKTEYIAFLLKNLLISSVLVLKAQHAINPHVIIGLNTLQRINFVDKAAQVLIVFPGFVFSGKPVFIGLSFYFYYV